MQVALPTELLRSRARRHYWRVLFGLLLCWPWLASAQRGPDNYWFFGQQAGIGFTGGGPSSIRSSVMAASENCAIVSDSTGALLFYTDGRSVWNARHQPMLNGQRLLGNPSATQGALIVQHPGRAKQYFLFTIGEEPGAVGPYYYLVDMAQQNGLGAVSRNVMAQLPTAPMTERLTGILHADGRDTWVVTHGLLNSRFYASLVSPAGVSAPIISSIGPVDSSRAGYLQEASYMVANKQGTKIAAAINGHICLFDFDKATGQVTGVTQLPMLIPKKPTYGLAFSPDGSRLYVSMFPNMPRTPLQVVALFQLDVSLPTAAEIYASAQRIPMSTRRPGALLPGPDGRVYVAFFDSPWLGVIQNPNARGALACALEINGVSLASRKSTRSLPNFPNAFPRSPYLTFNNGPFCIGNTANFAASLTPALGIASATWDFGEPASGAGNTATGTTVSHTYRALGTYKVTLEVVLTTGAKYTSTQLVAVTAPPTAQLGPDKLVCPGQPITLSPGAQPDRTSYLWQDGSSQPTFTASQSGKYWVQVTSPQGCVSSDTVRVGYQATPTISLGRDTTICLDRGLVLQPGPQRAGATYRWQDGSTNAAYEVLNPGKYTVEVTVDGCVSTGEIEVTDARCPVDMPNVITPNNDDKNETFVVRGINAKAFGIRIFNRWGREVFRQISYDNSWRAEGQPNGVYYYLLDNPVTKQQYKGNIEVMR
ncbi:T9SS type B sorting domain-containing protein [Hymenobacter oligotrophus]|nr:gliding motility-associated C-terminal domain-containing protein [Hymenobacter oligotrophus]